MALVGDEKLSSHNLRDFLSIKDDVRRGNLDQGASSAAAGARHNPSGLTLYAILSENRSPPPPRPEQRVRSNRTLQDVIREDRAPGRGRGSWRHLREKIRLRNGRGGGGGGSAWSSAAHTNESAQPGPGVDRYEEVDSGAAEQPARMSLMALLAENDRQMGVEGSAFVVVGDEGVSDESFSGGVSCCVCMVRGKGAAFIPCGHTFCRLCSRELWAQRGNCPLCNNHISEILDLF